MFNLGRMIVGIVYEIINLINFIKGNIVYVRKYMENLIELLIEY